MGRHIVVEQEADQAEDIHPGCMWGIIHALDYHRWWRYNIRKNLLHKKQLRGTQHAKRRVSPRRSPDACDSGELENLLDDENCPILVDQRTTKDSPTHRRSIRARIKALVSEGTFKEAVHKRQVSDFRAQSPLQRTYSIHHLEPTNHGYGEKFAKWMHPIIFFNDNGKTSVQQQGPAQNTDTDKPDMCRKKSSTVGTKSMMDDSDDWNDRNRMQSPEKSKNGRETSVNNEVMQAKIASDLQFKDHVDVLNIFKIEKESFLEVIQNTDGSADFFHNVQSSNGKVRLTKSGSFPLANFSRDRKIRPSKLRDKHNEVWSHPKGEKLLAGSQAPKLVEPQLLKNYFTKSGPLLSGNGVDCVLNQETGLVSSSSTQELDEEGSNVTREGESAHDDSSSCCGTNLFATSTYRRASSLNESLDKYSRLFERSFSREDKWNRSKSLMVTNYYENSSSGHAPSFFKRNQSLSQLDFHWLLQNEVSDDVHYSLMPLKNLVENNKNIQSGNRKETEPVGLSETAEELVEYQKDMVEKSESNLSIEFAARSTLETIEETSKMNDHDDEMDETMICTYSYEKEGEVTFADMSSNELPQSSSGTMSQSCLHEEVATVSTIPVPGVLEFGYNDVDKKESPCDFRDEPIADTMQLSCSSENLQNFENANQRVKNHIYMHLHSEDGDDLNYVREILGRSGLGNGFIDSSKCSVQQLNPWIFEELEGCWPHEPDWSGESYCYHHQLLFDLSNEVLVRTHERSFTYYPKALSASCRVLPMAHGNHVLEEVWTGISRRLRLKPGPDHSLDDTMIQDLSEDDSWMNLQLESECVALELEDLIFDELLDEAASS